MSALLNATGDKLTRSSGFPTFTSWTLAFWVKMATDMNTYSAAFYWGDNDFNDGLYVGTTDNGTTINVDNFPSGNRQFADFVVGTWVHLAIVNASSTITPYINGVAQLTITSTQAPSNTIYGFGDVRAGEFVNGYYAYARMWEAGLTAAEIVAERNSAYAARTTNLFTDCSFLSNANDASGNARHFTEGGTVTYDADMPPLRSPIIIPPARRIIGTLTR